jgi:hypothetical protein
LRLRLALEMRLSNFENEKRRKSIVKLESILLGPSISKKKVNWSNFRGTRTK